MLGFIGSAIGGALNYFGAQQQNQTAQEIANRNIELQREFATTGIQWKVRDAKKAGIHPLYALGAQTHAFAPVNVGTVNEMAGPAAAMGAMGQNLDRAIHATRSQGERSNMVAGVTAAATGLQLENQKLQNDYLKARIAQITGPQVGPPLPGVTDAYQIPGQSGSPLIKQKPLETAPAAAQQPSSEGGAIADVGYARTTTGWAPVPSKDVKERIEDQLIPELMWAFRNNVLPTLGVNRAPPPFPAPGGERWWFNPIKQEYQLIPLDSRPRGNPQRTF